MKIQNQTTPQNQSLARQFYTPIRVDPVVLNENSGNITNEAKKILKNSIDGQLGTS